MLKANYPPQFFIYFALSPLKACPAVAIMTDKTIMGPFAPLSGTAPLRIYRTLRGLGNPGYFIPTGIGLLFGRR